MTTTRREQFEQILSANPTDTDTRLVFADWLEDNGDTDAAKQQRAIAATMVYTLKMCDGVSVETTEIFAATLDEAVAEAGSECEDWCKGGDWGTDGASIDVGWTLYQGEDEDGDPIEVESGNVTVEIEPDHEALIRKAAGRDGCGTDPDDHDWTSEGEGGCRENPGVWSHGGTRMSFASHCRTCGLRRREMHCGSQRNPGEHDTIAYEMPERWCVECQSEDCECEQDEE